MEAEFILGQMHTRLSFRLSVYYIPSYGLSSVIFVSIRVPFGLHSDFHFLPMHTQGITQTEVFAMVKLIHFLQMSI